MKIAKASLDKAYLKNTLKVTIPNPSKYVDEVEIGQSPARDMRGAITKEKFVENMDNIKQLILSNETNPEKRIKLMNGVMVALNRVDDKKERQEITQIFNNDHLILNFINTYLCYVIQNKLAGKFQILNHIKDYNMTEDILS